MEFNDIRVFFTKTDTAKYISHLDLMRCMSRAVKRAQIPLWYTEGFNPHIFMTFARPLSLGQESLCEVVDVRLDGEMTFKELQMRWNAALPQGITVVAVQKPVHKPTEIVSALYTVTLSCKNPEAVCEQIQAAFSAAQILVLKKAKQGRRKVEKEMDIKPCVLAFAAQPHGHAVELSLQLTAGDKNNLNPTLLLSALTKDCAAEIENTRILKTKILLENGEAFC